MFFSATLLTLAGIARFVAAQSNGTAYPYMVAPGEFNQVDKNNDCLAQRNSCRQICGGIAPTNNCDAVSPVSTSPFFVGLPTASTFANLLRSSRAPSNGHAPAVTVQAPTLPTTNKQFHTSCASNIVPTASGTPTMQLRNKLAT